jgi:hypothetical protein
MSLCIAQHSAVAAPVLRAVAHLLAVPGLCAIGITVLAEVWAHQPRSFPQLQVALNRRGPAIAFAFPGQPLCKCVFGIWNDGLLFAIVPPLLCVCSLHQPWADREEQLAAAVATLGVCRRSPLRGSELLPLLSRLLRPEAEPRAMAIALQALGHLCVHGAVDFKVCPSCPPTHLPSSMCMVYLFIVWLAMHCIWHSLHLVHARQDTWGTIRRAVLAVSQGSAMVRRELAAFLGHAAQCCPASAPHRCHRQALDGKRRPVGCLVDGLEHPLVCMYGFFADIVIVLYFVATSPALYCSVQDDVKMPLVNLPNWSTPWLGTHQQLF